MRRRLLTLSMGVIAVGALVFAYALAVQAPPASHVASPTSAPPSPIAMQAAPTAPAAATREPSAPLKPDAWADEPFLVHTEASLAAYNMANGVRLFGLPPGLLSADGKRYVTLADGGTLTQYDVSSGRALQQSIVPGTQHWQLSAIDATGRWAALTRVPTDVEKSVWTKASKWQTDIQVVDLGATNANLEQSFRLDGNFDVDALGPGGASLYLIEHVPAVNPEHYLIRLLNLQTGRLQDGALRDKLAQDDLMTGLAWSSLGTPDGNYLLTLYLDTVRHVAFIHTLDLVNQFPVCIDLPSGSGDLDLLKQYTLAVTPHSTTVYAANAALGVVAEISMQSKQVSHVETFAPNALGIPFDNARSTPAAGSVLSRDVSKLFFTRGWDVWSYDTGSRKVDGPILVNAPIASLGLSGDGRRLYIASAQDPVLVFDSANGAPLSFPSTATSMSGQDTKQ